MTITLEVFWQQLITNPVLQVIALLIFGVIMVNGWTDAPNAIATCVSTRSMSPSSAILMAAVFNFFGVLVMTIVNATVPQTIYKMVDFGGDPHMALVALATALLSIVLWATAAWWFGIPTSESHALIAGISGAAIALQGGMDGINPDAWVKVLYGLVLSTGMGWLMSKGIGRTFKRMNRKRSYYVFKNAQVSAAAGMAFMHGAQDGQKFMGVFMLGIFLTQGKADTTEFVIPIWLMILCSLIMAVGTSIGGYRIIKSVGMDMVKLETYQGFSADLAAVTCLFTSSIFRIPVSTTHTKTTAIMGVGAAKRLFSVNWGVVQEMAFTWILTFPGCGLIGFLMAAIFMKVY